MKRRRYRRNPRLIPTQDAKSASQAATAPPIENLIFHFPRSLLFCKLAGVRCTASATAASFNRCDRKIPVRFVPMDRSRYLIASCDRGMIRFDHPPPRKSLPKATLQTPAWRLACADAMVAASFSYDSGVGCISTAKPVFIDHNRTRGCLGGVSYDLLFIGWRTHGLFG